MPRISDAGARLMEAARTLIWENSYGSISVDAICQRAGVRKGSFYHFFESKSTLAAEALEADWQARRAALDEIFSPQSPPLERLGRYLDHVLDRQVSTHARCGCVLGCPILSLGCEVSTQDPVIRTKVREILDRQLRYFETAIRDAGAEGSITAAQPRVKARSLYALIQGSLAQARILDDIEVVHGVRAGVCDLLGIAALPSPIPGTTARVPAGKAKSVHIQASGGMAGIVSDTETMREGRKTSAAARV